MERDSIQDSTRYVVSGLHRGSVIPGKRNEMWKDVYLEPGAKIQGSIWGNELQAIGPDIEVTGSVYCRGAIRIRYEKQKSKTGEIVNFGSSVVSPDSVMVDAQPCKTRFNTDIYSGIVNLKNSIVYGNVYATNAIIKDSVIFGGIYCKKKLEISNSVIFTFDAVDTRINDRVCMLAPFALSKSSLELNDVVRAISFFDLLEDEHSDIDGFVELNQEDIFKVKTSALDNGGESDYTHVMSFSERVLNSEDIIDAFRKNRNIIERFTLQSHLSEEDRKDFEQNFRNKAEKKLWGIIDHGIDGSKLEGHKSYAELLERISE